MMGDEGEGLRGEMDARQLDLWEESEETLSAVASAARMGMLDMVAWCLAAERWPRRGAISALAAVYAADAALQIAEEAAQATGHGPLAEAVRALRVVYEEARARLTGDDIPPAFRQAFEDEE